MQRNDIVLSGVIALTVGLLLFLPGAMNGFIQLTGAYPFLMSFAKFAVLATLGECIALRITTGVYNRPGFGVLPRAVTWGVLGLVCKLTFSIFAGGTPGTLMSMGISLPEGSFSASFVGALGISVFLNTFFAPLLMLLHKLSDIHIAMTGGTLSGFFSRPDVPELFRRVDWNVMWGFVYKKTLPLFWIPAHTITFMLPPYFQVLFAAILGLVLGIILAFAGLKAKNTKTS